MITAASISSRILSYYTLVILLVPYLAARILDLLDILRVDDGILKIDAYWDENAPRWMQWFVDVVPDSVWLALPEQIISLLFVSICSVEYIIKNAIPHHFQRSSFS